MQRIYRVENRNGGGVYQGDPDLGSRIDIVDHYDCDGYHKGRPVRQKFKSRGGVIRIAAIHDLIMDQADAPIPCCATQMCFPFDDAPISEGVPTTRQSLFDLNMQSEYRLDFRWLSNPQLELDVTLPKRIVRRQVVKDGSYTLAELLARNHNTDYADDYASGSTKRPAPRHDGLAKIKTCEFFAFESLEHLNDWFEGVTTKNILDTGGVIRVMDVRKVRKGGRQLVYRKRDVVKEFLIKLG